MRICCAGEVMVEIAAAETPGLYRRGVAGDSYNTAIYLARAGFEVSYLSALGDDPASDEILAALAAENINTGLIERRAGRQPGLYLIDNDPDGERRFSYWRDHTPAREVFRQPPQLAAFDVFYFTGITLAVTREHAHILRATVQQLRRQNCRIVFDPNYRPALWDSVQQAREHCAAVLPLCDIVLPTLSDDAALWDVHTVEQSRDVYLEANVGELVIKGDRLTAHVFKGDEQLQQTAQPVQAVDTTGAGDAFNAGYLGARLRGDTIAEALHRAQTLAAAVVQHRGAVLPHTTES